MLIPPMSYINVVTLAFPYVPAFLFPSFILFLILGSQEGSVVCRKVPQMTMTCVSSSTSGRGGSKCPFTDRAPCWMWMGSQHQQIRSSICQCFTLVLLKLLQWILHIPMSCVSLAFLFAFISCAACFSLVVFLDMGSEHFPVLPTLLPPNFLSSGFRKHVLFLVIKYLPCKLFCTHLLKSLLKVQLLPKALIMAQKK